MQISERIFVSGGSMGVLNKWGVICDSMDVRFVPQVLRLNFELFFLRRVHLFYMGVVWEVFLHGGCC